MYVIRYEASKSAAAEDDSRKLVKLSDPNLWKPGCPMGEWQKGHEIRSDAIGVSLFVEGTKQKAHYHERTWELYQVLEGSLRIAVKRFRMDSWSVVVLGEHDILLLAPGIWHLVDDPHHKHTTQVVQAPPALSDLKLIENEAYKGPEEAKAADEALNDARESAGA